MTSTPVQYPTLHTRPTWARMMTKSSNWAHKSQPPPATPPGTTAAYLAVLHDRPAVLRFLKRECNVNLRQPCDPHDYGTPAFYAAQMGRSEILVEVRTYI